MQIFLPTRAGSIIKPFIQGLSLFIGGLVLSIIIGEMLLKIYNPLITGKLLEMTQFRLNEQDLTKCFTLDPEFGFRPILGNNLYNRYGTKVNNYSIKKKPSITRLLFIGDSVTARGKVIDALRQLYGEEKFEYWNAGVESFNTVQEVNFYLRYNYRIKPDHVMLFFHINDFETTPVAFLNKESKLVVYAPYSPTIFINRWLFQNSYLYRLLYLTQFNLCYRKDSPSTKMNERIIEQTEKSLRKLKAQLLKNNIKLTVVIIPIIDNYERWSMKEKESRVKITNILNKLHIKYFDLSPMMDKVNFISDNLRKTSQDRWHPTNDIADDFAKFLFEKKF